MELPEELEKTILTKLHPKEIKNYAVNKQKNQLLKSIDKSYFILYKHPDLLKNKGDIEEKGVIYGDPRKLMPNAYNRLYMITIKFKQNENKYVGHSERTEDEVYSDFVFNKRVPKFTEIYNAPEPKENHDLYGVTDREIIDLTYSKNPVFWIDVDSFETDDYVINKYDLDLNNYILSGYMDFNSYYKYIISPSNITDFPGKNFNDREVYNLYNKKYKLSPEEIVDHIKDEKHRYSMKFNLFNPDKFFKNNYKIGYRGVELIFDIRDGYRLYDRHIHKTYAFVNDADLLNYMKEKNYFGYFISKNYIGNFISTN